MTVGAMLTLALTCYASGWVADWKWLAALIALTVIFDAAVQTNQIVSQRIIFSAPQATRGRANIMALYSGYGNNIRLDRGDSLVTHPSDNGRVVTLEYEVHGKIRATDTPFDNRFVSIATIENRKIVRWRDYMDSLAAWRALNAVT